MKQTLEQTLSGLQLGYDQGGYQSLETNSTVQVTYPISFDAYGIPAVTYIGSQTNVFVRIQAHDNNSLTIGASRSSGSGTLGTRFIIIGQ